jgi:hypothetical protein
MTKSNVNSNLPHNNGAIDSEVAPLLINYTKRMTEICASIPVDLPVLVGYRTSDVRLDK